MSYLYKLSKLTIFYFFVFLMLFCNSAFGAFHEVKINSSETGTTYIIPAYSSLGEDAYNPVSIDEFYVKDVNGNELTALDIDTKATLYGVSLTAYNFKKENYWKLRKHAESTYYDLVSTIGGVRAEIFEPKATFVSIGISAAGGCAVGATTGAILGSAVPLFGNAAGAVGGCLLIGAAGGLAATIDEAGQTAVALIGTYDDMSREEISKIETEHMLGMIYKLSCDIKASTIKWVDNGSPITTDELLKIVDDEMVLHILTNAMANYTYKMYPESYLLSERFEKWASISVGWAFNCVELADTGSGWGGIPASTIMSLVDYWCDFSDAKLDSDALLIDINNQLLAPELRNDLFEFSPISPTNININKAKLELREPVEYLASNFISGSNIFNIDDLIEIQTILQRLGESYPDANINYIISDWKGNTLETGQGNYDGTYYSINFFADGNPGNYTVAVSAKDADGNDLGGSSLKYTILNPSEGHELSLNSCSASRSNAIQGEHTVKIDLTVSNIGIYQENVLANLIVTGPNGYSFTSTPVSLGSITPGYTQSYISPLQWSVPSSVSDGSYSLRVNVVGEDGDISPVNNSKELFLYVGDYNRETPIAMIGKEVLLDWDPDLELAQYFDTPLGYGGFGWVNYTNNGISYQIAVSGVLKNADRVNGEMGIVVKRNNSIVYSSGGINEDVGEPIYVTGTPLIIYTAQTDSSQEEILMVISESFSGVGFDVRERSSIPGLDVEYNTVTPNLSCSNYHTYIHRASVNSRGEWNYNICWIVQDDISYSLAECNATGRKIFLSSPTVKKHYFVVEHRSSSQPNGYNPQISGYDSLQSYTYYWLTGILNVQDYNDISLSEALIRTQFNSGTIETFSVQIQKEGTITPDAIDLVWSINGPNDFQFDKTTDGIIGVNYLEWDTNGLEEGQYSLSVKALSSGDYDTQDITINKTIILDPPLPTQINEYTPGSLLQVNEVQAIELVQSIKEGQNYELGVELIDSSGNCKKEGFAYARQNNSSGECLATNLLIKDSVSCFYRGNFPIQSGTAEIEVVGHLNRHDDGDLVIPITVTPNEAPTALLTHNYDSLNFQTPQTITFYGSGTDPDNDEPLILMWEVTNHSGSTEYISNVGNIDIELSEAGQYQLTFYTIDGLGKQSELQNKTISLTTFGLDTDGDGIPDYIENTSCTDPLDADTDDDGILDGFEDEDHDGVFGIEDNETHPCNPDSDSDGIQDGTELGYTLDNVGPDTDLSVFQPDLDPDSMTDPKKADTNGDGILDGEHDTNSNGRVDDGESDPNRSPVKALPFIPILLLE